MRKSLWIGGGILLIVLIVMCGILSRLDANTVVQLIADRVATERYEAEAGYEENLGKRLQAEGEKALKIAEGEAITKPAKAAAFAVYIQSLLVVFWNICIPLLAVATLLARFLYPLAVAVRKKIKRKYCDPEIVMQDDLVI